jgi:hypothetical protein
VQGSDCYIPARAQIRSTLRTGCAHYDKQLCTAALRATAAAHYTSLSHGCRAAVQGVFRGTLCSRRSPSVAPRMHPVNELLAGDSSPVD